MSRFEEIRAGVKSHDVGRVYRGANDHYFDDIRWLLERLEETREALEWSLDLIDIYDLELIKQRHDPGKVYSETHMAGKMKARQVLSRLREGVGDG